MRLGQGAELVRIRLVLLGGAVGGEVLVAALVGGGHATCMVRFRSKVFGLKIIMRGVLIQINRVFMISQRLPGEVVGADQVERFGELVEHYFLVAIHVDAPDD